MTLAQATDAANASQAKIESVFDFIVKGGPVMIPIGICSLFALSIIIERLISLRRSRVIPQDFVEAVRAAMGAAGDRSAALDLCRSKPGAIANVFAAAIKRLSEPEELRDRHIQEAGEREAVKLRKHLRALSVVGSVTPLLGLLGTITGMITAFQTVAASGEALGRTELLAKGIYEAMITTAAGLIVAIPVVVCYHWLTAKVDGLVVQIDQTTLDFIEEYAPSGSTQREAAANGQPHDHHARGVARTSAVNA